MDAKQVKKRFIGFDAMRFWGVFLIFLGHSIYSIIGNVPYGGTLITTANPEIVNAATWLKEFWHAGFWANMVSTGVPFFVVMSGYFSIRKPIKKTDWIDTKNSFLKYVVFWAKWALLGTLLTVLFPDIWVSIYSGLVGATNAEKIELFFEALFCTSSIKGYLWATSINWTVVGLAWCSLFSFVLKPFYQTRDIKSIRVVTAVVVFMTLCLTTITKVGGYFYSLDEMNLVAKFFANFNILGTNGLGVSDWKFYWIPWLMIGGWYAVDKEAQNFVRNLSWIKVILSIAVSIVIYAFVCHYFRLEAAGFSYYLITYYDIVVCIPAASYFLLAEKINYSVSENSLFGKIVAKFGTDNVCAMIASYTFGTVLMGTVFSFVYDWINLTFTSPGMYTLIILIYNFLCYVLLISIIHILRPICSKIPFIKGYFYWDDFKCFDKEREKLLATNK